MALCIVGLHDWVYVRDNEKNTSYRYCSGCGKWQKFGGNYGDTWWDDCERPNNWQALK